MNLVDRVILNANNAICKNIDLLSDSRLLGLLSINILSSMRTLVDHIALKEWAEGEDVEASHEDIRQAIKAAKGKARLRPLMRLHGLLQISESHFSWDEDGSERLLVKYLDGLYWIRDFVAQEYGLRILNNLERIPLDSDVDLKEYYELIAKRVDNFSVVEPESWSSHRYYMQRIKPFVVRGRLYYEMTFSRAIDAADKQGHFTVFSRFSLDTSYAVKISVNHSSIHALGIAIPITVLAGYEVSIRPCELKNMAKVVGLAVSVDSKSAEYRALMDFLSRNRMNLLDLCQLSDGEYSQARSCILARSKEPCVFRILDKIRLFLLRDASGSNTVKYLLTIMSNRVIKKQYSCEPCAELSGLNLSYRCIPFDEMPLCTSLVGHNPRIQLLSSCIDFEHRAHELLCRRIRSLSERNGALYVSEQDLGGYSDPDGLVKRFNDALYSGHRPAREIGHDKRHYFIRGYEDDVCYILKALTGLTSKGFNGYEESVSSYLRSGRVDCPEKREMLKTLYAASRVSLVYGSAGTGKTTLIGHLADCFSSRKKLFLANTNPAVDNLKRRVVASHSAFSTIASFIASTYVETDFDLVVIDECSTVGNGDMRAVLKKLNCRLLLLVGDVRQIEAISFGNWFCVAREFLPSSAVRELEKPYRTKDQRLLKVWKRVRDLEDDVSEYLVRYGYTARLDNSIFKRSSDDEIVLCLNYDGLYGINNINRILQCANDNPEVKWGMFAYKVGDPVLFCENDRYRSVLHNNLKGWIAAIERKSDSITFDIEVDKVIDRLQLTEADLLYVGLSAKGNTVLRLIVKESTVEDDDDDVDDWASVVPFRVAYAVSIHKAQGLEFDSVKVVLTDEVGERVTHNVFYTAITRARRNLKIYWSAKTEHRVLSQMKVRDDRKTVGILKSRRFS